MAEALQINLPEILQKNLPRGSKWIPKFVVKRLEKYFKINELNKIFREHKEELDHKFIGCVLTAMGVNVEVYGLENIPKHGGAILASNHPMGGLDGMCIIQEVAKVRPDIKVIVNSILTHVPQLSGIFTGVNKLGRSTKESLAKIDKIYASGAIIQVFPAGLCSRKIDGKIVDLDWHKSFVSKSIENNIPIIPIYVNGSNSNSFYRMANFRKWIGLKFNVEMMMLPNEMFIQQGKKVQIIIGKPINLYGAKRNQAQMIANQIKQHVYMLETNPEASFN